jgi:hypothetical protein
MFRILIKDWGIKNTIDTLFTLPKSTRLLMILEDKISFDLIYFVIGRVQPEL